MSNDLFDDDYDLEEDNSFGQVNMDSFNENKSKFTNEKLCDIIVANRYLNINEEITAACMEELAIRRSNGDSYNFEKIIEDKIKELPELPNLSFNSLYKNPFNLNRLLLK